MNPWRYSSCHVFVSTVKGKGIPCTTSTPSRILMNSKKFHQRRYSSNHFKQSNFSTLDSFLYFGGISALSIVWLLHHNRDDSTRADQVCLAESANPSTWTSSSLSSSSSSFTSRPISIRDRSLTSKYNVDWMTVLGEGAYGSVHPARLAATGEKVALKKISKRYTDTSSFWRETDALLRLYNNGGHPNISGLRDMYEDEDFYYLVMDLVSGGEMFDHLIEYGAYSEADASRLMAEVASALAFLHGVGVTHADLKPENLLLCSKKRVDGTIKIIDFGCAVVEKEEDLEEGGVNVLQEVSATIPDKNVSNSDDNNITSTQEPIHMTLGSWLDTLNKSQIQAASNTVASEESTGTTAYWPPERFYHQKRRKLKESLELSGNKMDTEEMTQEISSSRPTPAGDMWAVGVILYIMLTGVHPFDLTGVSTDAEIAERIQQDPSPPFSPSLTGHLSPSAINLIQMLMDPNPVERLTARAMTEHPWIAGDAASTEIIENSAERLSRFQELRAIIEAGIFSILIERGSRDMALSEYAPKMVYKDDRRGGEVYDSDRKIHAPATSVLKRAFEAFDEGGKGYVSSDDLGRVITETTGHMLSDSEKNEMVHPFDTDTAGSLGLSLSSFASVIKGFKHKHYPRGHIIFRAGDEGDAMYFINSGKVEIQTRKGQLVHILRHGDFFGEGSLLEKDNSTRFSTAKCATPVDLIKIKKSDFEKYTNSSKSARDTLMWRWRSRALADAKALIRLQTNLKPRMFEKGEYVYKEGDIGGGMYFVDEERGGILDVKHGTVTVHQIRPGESFGESSLLFGRPRSSTVICASEKCFLHEMMGTDFLAFLETSPETKAKLLNMCRKRLFKKAVKKYSMEQNTGFKNDDLIKAFHLIDVDKNGQLDHDEVKQLMHAMDPSISDVDIAEFMKYIDVDDDGKLSFKDFKRLFRSFEFEEPPPPP